MKSLNNNEVPILILFCTRYFEEKPFDFNLTLLQLMLSDVWRPLKVSPYSLLRRFEFILLEIMEPIRVYRKRVPLKQARMC